MKKGSWKYSVIHSKCPKCNEGDLWETKKSYAVGFDKMKTNCDRCGLIYDREQGFWYGAMYISYAMSVLTALISIVFLTLFTNWEIWVKLVVIVAVLVLLVPFIFRYSRNIWLNIFVHFDPHYSDEKKPTIPSE